MYQDLPESLLSLGFFFHMKKKQTTATTNALKPSRCTKEKKSEIKVLSDKVNPKFGCFITAKLTSLCFHTYIKVKCKTKKKGRKLFK